MQRHRGDWVCIYSRLVVHVGFWMLQAYFHMDACLPVTACVQMFEVKPLQLLRLLNPTQWPLPLACSYLL